MDEKKKSFYHVSELIPSISDELLPEKPVIPEDGFLRYGLPSFALTFSVKIARSSGAWTNALKID